VLSEAAASKLQELVTAEQNPNMGLRVYVYSGGCSGYRYGMMLEDQPSNEDIRVQSRGVNVYVDPQSTQYLTGSEIDYLDTSTCVTDRTGFLDRVRDHSDAGSLHAEHVSEKFLRQFQMSIVGSLAHDRKPTTETRLDRVEMIANARLRHLL
jgi:iron-sulfur cluster assembly accessory protein